MRILHTVEFYEPRKGGAEEVVKQLSERLAAAGHEVTVATSFHPGRTAGYLRGVKIEQFAIRGNQVNGISGSAEEIRRYQDLLCSGFDVVLNYAAQSWTTDLALPVLYRITAKKILVPCGYSGLHHARYATYFSQLPPALRQYDRLIYMSKNYQDAEFGRQHGLADTAVYIPNGAAEEEFAGPDIHDFKRRRHVTTPHMALCVANHYVGKGHRFVIQAFRALRRTDTTLVIIGTARVSSGWRSWAHLAVDFSYCFLMSLLNRRIRLITDATRADVISAYMQADVFMFGSALECAPLVMYESFASRTPFVTRPVGNVADHRSVLKIVETPPEMARVVGYILDDPETRKEISDRAYELWRTHHTWKHIASLYEALYTQCIQS